MLAQVVLLALWPSDLEAMETQRLLRSLAVMGAVGTMRSLGTLKAQGPRKHWGPLRS